MSDLAQALVKVAAASCSKKKRKRGMLAKKAVDEDAPSLGALLAGAGGGAALGGGAAIGLSPNNRSVAQGWLKLLGKGDAPAQLQVARQVSPHNLQITTFRGPASGIRKGLGSVLRSRAAMPALGGALLGTGLAALLSKQGD
jgi:hypothetical protein